jgi:predicted nucleic acid-binding protein
MTHVLDSGGVSRLVQGRALLALLRQRGEWPPEVPAVVLVECLTGDHRRDHAVNRLLSMCIVRPVDEPLARRAAVLRGRSGRADEIAATDAVVVALAERVDSAVVVTSDPRDITDLVDQSGRPVRVVAV